MWQHIGLHQFRKPVAGNRIGELELHMFLDIKKVEVFESSVSTKLKDDGNGLTHRHFESSLCLTRFLKE